MHPLIISLTIQHDWIFGSVVAGLLDSPGAHFLQAVSTGNAAIWVAIFAAASASSIVGFAFSPIAGAIIFHVDGSYLHAVQTMLTASIALQSYSVYSLRRTINLNDLAPFVLGGLLMLMPGVYFALHCDPRLIVAGIGIFLLLYGLQVLCVRAPRLNVDGQLGDFFAGAMGGLTGPIAAFPSGFVTVWCGVRNWDKSRQRATYQPYILIMQVVTLIAIMKEQPAIQPSNLSLLQYAIPAVIGAHIGLSVFRRLDEKSFTSIVAAFLMMSGFVMVIKGVL